MILLVALSQSDYSSSSDGQKVDDRFCDVVDGASPISVSLLNSNSFVSSVPSFNNKASFTNHEQSFVKLEQSRFVFSSFFLKSFERKEHHLRSWLLRRE